MRITIDTDDKGKVKIDTGEKIDELPGLFGSATDVSVIDAGPAPIQEIERMQKAAAASETGLTANVAAAPPEQREKELPLNPLRAGAAAAYQDPANLKKKAAASEATFAAQPQQQLSTATSDGGAAPVPEGKKASAAPTSERQSSKRGKSDKKR
jgi:hypothetical protein